MRNNKKPKNKKPWAYKFIAFIKKQWLTIFLAILFPTVFLKFWIVSKSPLTGIGELWQGLFALYIIKFGIVNYIFNIPFLIVSHQGPMMGYILIPTLKFFGQTAFALRLPRVIIGTLIAIFTFLFTNDFYDKKTAILTAFAFAIMPAYITLSQEHILTPFFLIISLYILDKFYKTKNVWYFYLFSFICGLGLISRLSFLFWLTSLAMTFKLSFKIQKDILVSKYLIIALFFFILGVYPLIFFNFRGTLHTKNRFPGTTQRENLLTVRSILKNFPQTTDGTNLLNVVANFKVGLIENFPIILVGYRYDYYLKQPPSLFLPLFIFSLMLLLIITIYNWFKHGFAFISKDVFLLLNFLIIASLISTLTVSVFRAEEFVMLSPICAIIVGRAISEILKISKQFWRPLSYFAILFIVCLLLVNIYIFFKPFIQRNWDKGEDSCISKGERVVNSILGFNHSVICVSDPSSIINFNWHMYNKGVYNETFCRFFVSNKLEDEDVLYVLAGEGCMEHPINENRTVESFLEIVDQYNKTAVIEDLFYLESGDLAYVIYRVI